MRVIVDRNRCAGSGFCVRIAPTLFELDADGLSTSLLEGELPGELEESATEAENACPATAVIVEE